MALQIPANYPVVGFGLAGLFMLNIWQGNRVIAARKTYGVALPNLYASPEEARADPRKNTFNCVQRSHQNTVETMAYIVGMTLFTALHSPVASTALAFTYILGRIGYTLGYATGEPKNRSRGLTIFQYIGTLGLVGHTLYIAGASAWASKL